MNFPNGMVVEKVGLYHLEYIWFIYRDGKNLEYNFFRENVRYLFLRIYSYKQSYDSPEYFMNAELIDEFSQFVSVENVLSKNPPKLYPNPTSESFYIEGMNEGRIEIYDLQGKILQSQKITQDLQSINISALNSGIYFVKIYENGSVQIQKLLKP